MSSRLGTLYIHATCLDYMPTYMYLWERALVSHQYTVNKRATNNLALGSLYYTIQWAGAKSRVSTPLYAP